MDSVRVGVFIAALRREQGMTQKQLAEKIGVTDKAISRCETGKGYPDGLPPARIFTFLQDCDAVALADDCPRIKTYNAVSVSFSNHLSWFFDEASEVSFGDYQNLDLSGHIKKVSSAAGMSGKYFEAVLTAHPNNQPCCSIYFQ